MIISVNWLKQLTEITLPIDELATLIGARLVEIEEVIDLGVKYKDVVVARVVSAQPLEGSDHLNVVRIDDGGTVQDIERGEDGLVQVVCGAPNVREGLLVAWLPPNSTVPETYDSDEPFVLATRKLRGVTSNGMIASARELGLWDEHEGILELDKDLAPGSSFAEGYELNDYLFDIENKSLTHRPDCFGVVGFAREVAAIQGNTFKTPEWLLDATGDFGEKQGDMPAPRVSIDNTALSARYEAVVLAGANGSAKSPLQLQTYLARMGVRPISAVVDVTNYLMLWSGQPLHAFDYDKLIAEAGGEAEIHVRGGQKGEKLLLLDDREIELSEEDIVIAAGEKAIGLAGAMGGASTEIDTNTKNIILESATFNLYNLRATQMRHGIFSEAITRFTKGQPAALGAPVLAEAVRLTGEYAGAKRVSDVADEYPGKYEPVRLRISISKVNSVLGTDFAVEEAADILRRVEFDVTLHDHEMTVTVPYWREDIHIAEDIIEEIGRLNGFDSIKPLLPSRDFSAVQPAPFDRFRADVRACLVRAGGNEVLTYSFVHGDMLEKAGQLREDSYRITNSISPDLQYYRQSLTPNLLTAVFSNIKQGFNEFALFELNKTHQKRRGLTLEQVPVEQDMLALVLAHKKPNTTGAPYYQAKRLLEYLAQTIGVVLQYDELGDTLGDDPISAPFEPKRAARVFDKKTGKLLGIVGEYKRSVGRAFKLPEYAAGFELDNQAFFEASRRSELHYRSISRYPGTERDMCFQVATNVAYDQVAEAALEALKQSDLETALEPVDIYQPASENVKNITLRVKMTSHDHTLTSEEAGQLVERIVQHVTSSVAAKLI
jgi:phenylalanyl-tRNA synthetase beta chain